MDSTLATIVLWAVPVVFAITLHEAAHGYVARIFGDQTAWMLGRVTLNPLKHIDPVGTIAVPFALWLMAQLTHSPPFIFGWAKPVPVNFSNLRRPKRDMIWVAGAGPGSNFLQALLWALVLVFGGASSEGVAAMAQIGVNVNLLLMALNILPIPPLDGGRILAGVLPGRASYRLSRLEPYGLFIILLLLATGLLDNLMRPLIHLAGSLIGTLIRLV